MKRYPLAHRIDTTHAYTPKDATDIRKTFARIRKQQAATKAPAPAPTTPPAVEPAPAPANVRTLRKAKP